MAKPVLNRIKPIDATLENSITFTWSGNRVYGNRLIIYDSDTMATIFDDVVTSYTLSHSIPPNTLINGKKYIAQCQTLDFNGEYSSLSDKLLFWSLATPTFCFNRLNDGDTIKNASYIANINYSQSDNEVLRSYKFYLYDAAKSIISESNELYDTTNIQFTYRGLSTSTNYFLRCVGTTVNGIDVDTGLIQIYVYYKNPSSYSAIYVENVKDKGYIKYNTNIIVIQYNGSEVFTYDNGKIDLTNKTLLYNEGFNIKGNAEFKLKGTNLFQTASIFELYNQELESIMISSRIYDDNSLRFKLAVPNGVGKYILYSKPLNFTNADMVTIVVRRVNNIYQMNIYINDILNGGGSV